MAGIKSKFEMDARNQRWAVYVGAALQRAKKMPPYSKFNPKPRPPAGPRGEAEMLAAFDARIQSKEVKVQ